MGILQRRFVRVAAGSVTAAAVSLAVLGAVTSAQASVVFDFVAIAALPGSAPTGRNEGKFINTASYATVGGITVQASASNNFGATSFAYLDDVAFDDLRDAGLGVCSAGLTASPAFQCTTASDDNVTAGETLTLSFFSDMTAMNAITVVLNPTFFRNADHNPGFTGNIDIQIDGMGFNSFVLINNFTTPLTGSVIDFSFIDDQFYIASVTVNPVPLPAALPLFLSALAGLALLGRRRRKKAAA